MIGIYKITNPKGKVYVGQSIDIENRWKRYKSLNCKSQIRLYNSFKKYGIENHEFSICQLLPNDNKINEWERYYQEFYDSIYKDGLNCKLTKTDDKSGKLSEETKLKISKSTLGKIVSSDTKLKMSEFQKGRVTSEETKLKISIANKGKSKNRTIKSKPKYKIIDTSTNKIFNSVYEVADKYNISRSTLYQYLSGYRKNKTTFKYLENEER